MDINDFFQSIEFETEEFECKRCKNKLPKEIWPTYSAFANTVGGNIILGISETNDKTKKFDITGVDNPDKICNEFWTCIVNSNKVSRNILTNKDVTIHNINNKYVIVIKVPEATQQQKPIYINGILTNTYIRLNSADVKVNDLQLQAFIRNQSIVQDSAILDNYTIERDLDISAINKCRQRLFERTNEEEFLNMKNEDFLIRIGAFSFDRKRNQYCLTEGGLLLFGKMNSILERFPHFHLDYFDKRGCSGEDVRWRDRIASDDISSKHLNLINYFYIIMDKLRATIDEPFELEDNLVRKSAEKLYRTLREAVVNMITHADYYINTSSIIINVYDAYYEFNNPGMMLITKQEFVRGGKSCIRNGAITTLFRQLGYSERAGSGGPRIFTFARKNNFKTPQIRTDFKETNIKIWKIEEADEIANHPEISIEAKRIFEYMNKQGAKQYSAKNIKDILNLKKYPFDKAIHELISLNLVEKRGAGRGTVYIKARSSLDKVMNLQNELDNIQGNLVKYNFDKKSVENR